MFESIYSANTGLQSFSKGLGVISDNVTNLNTVGYKATSLLYRNVHYNFDLRDNGHGALYGAQLGQGVAADITSLLFTQGDMRQTGNDTDVAIIGKGFFIFEKDGEYLYSRDGQFDFNSDGDLVTRNGGYTVMGLSASGKLEPINQDRFRVQPAAATTKIDFTGVVSGIPINTGTTIAPVTINNVTVYDALGGAHMLTVTLTRDTTTPTSREWQVEVSENGSSIGGTGMIRFQFNGSPEEGANTHMFTYQPAGGAAQQITLNFGEPNSFSNVTMFVGTSDVKVGTQDGRVQGSLLSLTFDDKGRLQASYSNQNIESGPQLALARFDDQQALLQLGGGLFRAQSHQRAIIGGAGTDAFGMIAAGRVEGSNVELSEQFTDMIVIQRGYQASSQILSAANEMMQQLLESNKR